MLLEVDSLTIDADGPAGPVPLVRHVSLQVERGEFVGLVGESGCGKSLTLRAILGLLPEPPYRIDGDLRLDGESLRDMSPASLRKFRGERMAMVPQDPMGSLDPVFTVRSQFDEVLKTHGIPTKVDGHARAVDLLTSVKVADAERRIDQYPYQFSGGMRQRVMVAMALACSPDLLMADEPTTALDSTTQAAVLRIMRDALVEKGMALILVTHDLAIIAELVDRVYVMYGGEIVEEAPTDRLFSDPRHPYTRGLLSSIPTISDAQDALVPIDGTPPNLASIPSGCAFAERCWVRRPICSEGPVPLRALQTDVHRRTRCLAAHPGGWRADKTLPQPNQMPIPDPRAKRDQHTDEK